MFFFFPLPPPSPRILLLRLAVVLLQCFSDPCLPRCGQGSNTPSAPNQCLSCYVTCYPISKGLEVIKQVTSSGGGEGRGGAEEDGIANQEKRTWAWLSRTWADCNPVEQTKECFPAVIVVIVVVLEIEKVWAVLFSFFFFFTFVFMAPNRGRLPKKKWN